MNRVVSKIYAISIGHEKGPIAGYTQRDCESLIGCLGDVCAEIQRLEDLLHDPIIAGYLEAKRRGMLMLGPLCYADSGATTISRADNGGAES